jgi:hypothetical protein
MLRNLNELSVEAKTRYTSNYNNKDVKLHNNFKKEFENYLQSKGDSIVYLDYSAEITIGASNNKIYLPNQWFCIATFLTDYVNELITYKNIINEIRINDEEHGLSNKDFWNFIKQQKDNPDNFIDEPLNDIIDDFFVEEDTYENDCDYLKKFITDYGWWNGSKTIDRQDYYVSPVLNILGVVNVAQTYIATIVYAFASVDTLRYEADRLLSNIEQEVSVIETVQGGKNLIVYGAPGTGKSKYVNDTYTNITRVVFHPEYTYYDFVGTYKPSSLYKACDSEITTIQGESFNLGEPLIDYSFIPGPLISSIIKAIQTPDEMHTLLIEEINRANAAAVFGDMFQLLDRKGTGRSEYTITPSKDLYAYLMSKDELAMFMRGLYIPSNLNIIATMNSADQGVYVLDSAFKRRWNFRYMAIIEEGYAHEDVLIPYAGNQVKWKKLLKSINEKLKNNRIEEDRLIGPYFINPTEIQTPSFITSKLFIYLWDDVLRHKRSTFFMEGVRTYSELISAYHSDQDVLGINEILSSLNSHQEEDSSEEE